MIRVDKYKFVALAFFLTCAFVKTLLFFYLKDDFHNTLYYMAVNPDEIGYITISDKIHDAILFSGWMSALENSFVISGSLHIGNYFYLASLKYFFGNNYIDVYVLSKIWFFSSIASISGYALLSKIKHRRVALAFVLFTSCYPVLGLYGFSLMRDDIVFSLMTLLIFLSLSIVEKVTLSNIIWLLVIIFVLSLFRINATVLGLMLALSLVISSNPQTKTLKISLFAKLLICSVISIVGATVFYFISGYLQILLKSLPSFNELLIETIKIPISPLPWNVTEQFNLLKFWSWISFLGVILSIIFFGKIVNSVKINLLPLLVLFLLHVLPYLIRDGGLGYRQGAIIMPFLFVFLFQKLIDDLRYKCERVI